MNKNEILNTILSIPGAVMARQNKTDFVVVPTDEGIVKVELKTALSVDTKNHKAFNLEAAVSEYKAHEAEVALRVAERANKPARVSGPNPEAEARRQELDKMVSDLPSFSDYTATDIYNALAGKLAPNVTVMAIGQSARRLVEKGVLTLNPHEGEKKAYYVKA